MIAIMVAIAIAYFYLREFADIMSNYDRIYWKDICKENIQAVCIDYWPAMEVHHFLNIRVFSIDCRKRIVKN